MKGLMNHCGAELITLNQMRKLPDPEPKCRAYKEGRGQTHYPLRHDIFIDEITKQLGNHGWEIAKDERGEEKMEFSILQKLETDRFSGGQLREKDTMFGVICLKSNHSDFQPTIGIRNSNTMHSKARFALGNRVFVCDNMCFFGEEQFDRKHTKNIYNELPDMVAEKIGKCRAQFEKDYMRIDHYKSTKIEGGEFQAFGNKYSLKDHDDVLDTIFSRASGSGVVLDADNPKRRKTVKIPGGDAFGPWRTNYHTGAGHAEFLRGDYWALLNGYTEVAKKHGAISGKHQERTRAVTTLLDEFSGFNRKWAEINDAELVAG